MGHAATHRTRRNWALRARAGGSPRRHEVAGMKRVVVVHGPNLNLLGKREPHIYGTRSLDDLNQTVRDKAGKLGLEVNVFQSNHEGEIIDFLQKEAPGSAGIVINPGALSHYSLALYRSEEHTSELQSRFDLVCRLLLEKKKKKKNKSIISTNIIIILTYYSYLPDLLC